MGTIQHPFLNYDARGGMKCIICKLPIKDERKWKGHVVSKSHVLNVKRFKEERSKYTTDAPEPSDSSSEEDRQDVLPADFFDPGVGRKEPRAPSLKQDLARSHVFKPQKPRKPGGGRKSSSSATSAKFLQVTSSMAAASFLPNVSETAVAAQSAPVLNANAMPPDPDNLEEVWAAFEKEVLEPSRQQSGSDRAGDESAPLIDVPDTQEQDFLEQTVDEFVHMKDIQSRLERLRKRVEARKRQAAGVNVAKGLGSYPPPDGGESPDDEPVGHISGGKRWKANEG